MCCDGTADDANKYTEIVIEENCIYIYIPAYINGIITSLHRESRSRDG